MIVNSICGVLHIGDIVSELVCASIHRALNLGSDMCAYRLCTDGKHEPCMSYSFKSCMTSEHFHFCGSLCSCHTSQWQCHKHAVFVLNRLQMAIRSCIDHAHCAHASHAWLLSYTPCMVSHRSLYMRCSVYSLYDLIINGFYF